MLWTNLLREIFKGKVLAMNQGISLLNAEIVIQHAELVVLHFQLGLLGDQKAELTSNVQT